MPPQRHIVENYPIVLDIFCLKSLLRSQKTQVRGVLTWRRDDERGNTIEIVLTQDDTSYTGSFRVIFSMTDKETGEKEALDYKIPLVATLCHFGGKRWWFLCPIKGNRCAKLYLQENGIFASRKTLGLTYSVQNIGKRQRQFNSIIGPDHDEIKDLIISIKYPYRNRGPTRKMRKYQKITRDDCDPEGFYWIRKLAMMTSG